MERFDIFAAQGGIGTSGDGTASTAGMSNGHEDNTDSITPPEPESSKHSASPQKRRADSDELSELSNAKSLTKSPPPKKKRRTMTLMRMLSMRPSCKPKRICVPVLPEEATREKRRRPRKRQNPRQKPLRRSRQTMIQMLSRDLTGPKRK